MNGRKPFFNEEQVATIRMQRDQGVKLYELSRLYGTSHVTIWKVLKGHKPYDFGVYEKAREVAPLPTHGSQ